MQTWLVVTHADWTEDTHSSAKITADNVRVGERGVGFYIDSESKNPEDDLWPNDTLVLFIPHSRIYSISLDGYDGVDRQ